MEGFTFDSDGEGERPAAVVPGTEATGSKDAPDDDVDSGGDIKAVKKKKTPAKTLVGVLWDYITPCTQFWVMLCKDIYWGSVQPTQVQPTEGLRVEFIFWSRVGNMCRR